MRAYVHTCPCLTRIGPIHTTTVFKKTIKRSGQGFPFFFSLVFWFMSGSFVPFLWLFLLLSVFSLFVGEGDTGNKKKGSAMRRQEHTHTHTKETKRPTADEAPFLPRAKKVYSRGKKRLKTRPTKGPGANTERSLTAGWTCLAAPLFSPFPHWSLLFFFEKLGATLAIHASFFLMIVRGQPRARAVGQGKKAAA